MNNQQTIIIPKEYKKNLDKSFNINGIDIMLPVYVRASISKYRFIIEEDSIFLQRQCKSCNQFFNVQKFENGIFTNIDNLQLKYIGERSGFHNTCNNCLEKSPVTPNTPYVKDNLAQLNIKIDSSLKKDLQIICIKHDITLQNLVLTALKSYKESKHNDI